MEQWQFMFPTWEGFDTYVYTFVSRDRLDRAGGFAPVQCWDGTTPIVGGHRGIRIETPRTTQPEKSGGSVDYYQVKIAHPTTKGRDPYTAECNDIIEALGMTYAEGNSFKALWRSCAARTLGKLKEGGDAVYDAEKNVFFANRILVQRKESHAN